MNVTPTSNPIAFRRHATGETGGDRRLGRPPQRRLYQRLPAHSAGSQMALQTRLRVGALQVTGDSQLSLTAV